MSFSRWCAGGGMRTLSIDPDALAALRRRAWPGNIRELRNVLDHASLFADDGVIRVAHLPAPPALSGPVLEAAGGAGDDALTQFAGTRSELAASLGISERTLYRRLRQRGTL